MALKPVVKMFAGGSVTAIAIGDSYKDPTTNQIVVYENAKVQIHLTKVKQALSFDQDTWNAMLDAFADPLIQKHLEKDWK